MAASPTEVILCDTSFVGHFARSTVKPIAYSHWPPATLDRLGAAQLAIAPFTIGEIRAGYRIGKWGAARIAAAENQLASFIVVPLDAATLDEYAELHAYCRLNGKPLHHNDLWIAATARSRGIELVSCDENQCALPGVRAIHLPPP